MAFDYKKEQKEFYLPKTKPCLVTLPKMNYLAVRGSGNPGDENGEYAQAISLLYTVAYTLKMSGKTDYQIDNFFEYVVPPLEGFWWQEGIKGVDYTKKDQFQFISLIRLPDFIREEDVKWAVEQAEKKKKQDFSKVHWLSYEEGICVQCMHIGPYDDEPATVERMHAYAKEQGYAPDISQTRYHHEIYISDPRRCDVSKLKTVIRHPVKKAD